MVSRVSGSIPASSFCTWILKVFQAPVTLCGINGTENGWLYLKLSHKSLKPESAEVSHTKKFKYGTKLECMERLFILFITDVLL